MAERGHSLVWFVLLKLDVDTLDKLHFQNEQAYGARKNCATEEAHAIPHWAARSFYAAQILFIIFHKLYFLRASTVSWQLLLGAA